MHRPLSSVSGRFPAFEAVQGAPDNVEVTAAGVDKGTALLALADRLGIPREATLAIGDSDNDAEMLRAVGMPVAMGNADAALKNLAKYITADCDHDGVAQAVYHLFK